jgi:multisubunit Na+/H+ antiporter MnhB subunit
MSGRNFAAVIFFVIVGLFLAFGALMMHPFGEFGEYGEENYPEMDQYIIDNTQNETGADNGVTSVVFDYRGFDTLGEATVLFTAVAGVILLFRRLKK